MAGLADEMRLVDAERQRLQSLADTRLTSPHDGEVLYVGVALGRHVSAGDSVATPKSSEKSEDLNAVPFPQTERREMYVVVKPDTDMALLRPTSIDGAPNGSCPVGKWVTVTRADGWVPSTSVARSRPCSRRMTPRHAGAPANKDYASFPSLARGRAHRWAAC